MRYAPSAAPPRSDTSSGASEEANFTEGSAVLVPVTPREGSLADGRLRSLVNHRDEGCLEGPGMGAPFSVLWFVPREGERP